MSNLAAQYAAQREKAQRRELDAWMAEQTSAGMQPVEATIPGSKPPAGAVDREKIERRNGGFTEPGAQPGRDVLAAGVGTALGTAKEGVSNFVGGVWRTLAGGEEPPAAATPRERAQIKAGQGAEGFGQALLGALQTVMAIPGGIGAAVEQAMKNYAPGLEGKVVPGFEGGEGGQDTLVGKVRATLGLPGLVLDPKARYDDPGLAAGLNQPMTYGELINTVTQFAAPFVYKGLRAPKAGAAAEVVPAGAPAPPARTVGQPALPSGPQPAALPPGPGTPKALPQAPLVTPPPMTADMVVANLMQERYSAGVDAAAAPAEAARAPRPFRADEPIILERFDPEAAAARDGQVLDPQGRPVESGAGPMSEGVSRERERSLGRTPLDAPPREADLTPGVQTPGPVEGPLDTAVTKAMAKTEEVVHELAQKAAALEAVRKEFNMKPKPAEGEPAVRAAEEPATKPLEVSPRELDALALAYQELDAAAPGQRFLFTDELGKVEGGLRQPSTYPDFLDQFGGKTKANADKLKVAIENILDGKSDGPLEQSLVKWAQDNAERMGERHGYSSLLDETGGAQRALLARMVVGAAAGATQGDTPEERVRNMLLGMGAGALASRANVTRLVEGYKASGLADETGAMKTPGGKRYRAQPGEEDVQPNYKRLDVTSSVRNTMVMIHRRQAEAIRARGGPPKTHVETGLAAEALIENGKMTIQRVLELGPEDMLNREEMVAARMLSSHSAQYAGDIAAKIRRGEATVPGSLLEADAVAGVMARNTRVAQKRQAQALEGNKYRVTPEGPTEYRAEDVAAIRDTIGDTVSEQELAEIYGRVGTKPDDPFHPLRAVAPRLILEAMYASVLSGKAIVRNAVGNILTVPIAIADRAVAPYMPKWGKPGPGVYPGEVGAMIQGYWEGFGEQLRLMRSWEAWGEQAERMGSDKIEARYTHEPITSADLNLAGPSAWAFDFVHGAIRKPLELMQNVDGAAKAFNGRAAIRVEAYRQAMREGLEGEAFTDRVVELASDPGQLDAASMQKVIDFRNDQVFTKDFEGRVLSAIQRGPEDAWLQLAYRNQVMQFFRTPLRIAEYGARHTPGLNMLAAEFWRDTTLNKTDPVKMQTAQAKLAVGAMVIGSFAWMESQGLITGTAPRDKDLAELHRAAGVPEKSAWDPVSKKWRSYDGFEPLTTLVATGADLSKIIRNLPEADGLHLTMAAVLSQVNNFESKTYMQSLSDLKEVLTTGGTDSQVEKALTFLRRRLAAFSPAALNEIREVTDPTRHSVKPSGEYDNPLVREFVALRDQYAARIPGLSTLRDDDGRLLIPPYRDPLTGVVDVTEGVPFNIIPGRAPSDNPVYAELRRLGATPDLSLPDFVGGSGAGADVGMAPAKATTGVRLTPQEKDRWVELMTQGVQDGQGRSLEQALAELIASSTYARASEDPNIGGKITRIRGLWGEFKDRSLKALRDESPALDDAMKAKETERAVRKAPTDQQDTMRTLLESIRR